MSIVENCLAPERLAADTSWVGIGFQLNLSPRAKPGITAPKEFYASDESNTQISAASLRYLQFPQVSRQVDRAANPSFKNHVTPTLNIAVTAVTEA